MNGGFEALSVIDFSDFYNVFKIIVQEIYEYYLDDNINKDKI